MSEQQDFQQKVELPNDLPPNGSNSGLFRTLAVVFAIAVICSEYDINIFDYFEDALPIIAITFVIVFSAMISFSVFKCVRAVF